MKAHKVTLSSRRLFNSKDCSTNTGQYIGFMNNLAREKSVKIGKNNIQLQTSMYWHFLFFYFILNTTKKIINKAIIFLAFEETKYRNTSITKDFTKFL